MSKRDYYKVLGVEKNADDAAIKKAYRRLAMKHHPDRNEQGDAQAEDNFKEAKEAYEVLSDSNKRAAYDQYGHDGVNQQAGGNQGGFHGDPFAHFRDAFRHAQQPTRGADLLYNMVLTLEEAAYGCNKEVTLSLPDSCDPCNGTGARAGTTKTKCGLCGGSGYTQRQHMGFFVNNTCTKCAGAGSVIEHPCKTCHGSGKMKKTKTLSVKIPEGVDTGSKVRLAGYGDVGGSGTQKGDLLIQVNVQPHPKFQRLGNDLACESSVDVVTATIGGSIEVTTLDKKQVNLKIPPGTQPFTKFKLAGQGIKGGSLICEVAVEIPKKITEKQKKLLKEFKKLTK